ncbi:MAG: M2 family metallopeptidase [Anaeromyxobacter sp.]|nr:M2 family metallopeptidase [Anaeromyxobacter sp.]MBL0278678.1 M2 family metallopeptidase [Anaeromyxobacter sp.]
MTLALLLAAALAAAPASSAPNPAPPDLAAPPAAAARQPPRPTAAEARAFALGADAELKRLSVRRETASWIQATFITDDTERNAAAMGEDLAAFLSGASAAAARFDGVEVDADTRRMLLLLKVNQTLPAPADAARRAELSTLATRLEGMYGKGKWCGADGKGRCRDLGELEAVLKQSRSWDQLEEAWTGWHATSREMRPLYARLVELGNEGARELGVRDLGDLWRSAYDLTPAEFEADTDRLWGEVRPLYEQLHCYVRAELQRRHGRQKVRDGQPIPAHLLGNMWAQSWENLYPDLTPYRGQPSLDVDGALRRQRWDATRTVKLGEDFFSSLGFAPLPATFWERSQLVKPRDREVVCHASAWDVTYSGDLRIKMCIKPDEDDLITVHHELGHNYYQRAYVHLPVLFQNGANDGFHEAIGDAIALSITPGYLKKVGLLARLPRDEKGTVNVQLKLALAKVAFLPFGKLIDQWRWDVFSGKTPPERYNQDWWALKARYQGVAPPLPRSEADFDPGAKYHVAANVPYTRYFLAHLYQFQFHKALCQAAGWKGPLHQCSIYGSKAAGAKLEAMLALGASRPWPEAYQVLTGTRRADASALLEYFAPLRAWLAKENAGRTCGW